MYTQRLQILLSQQQRRRLELEAKRRGLPVAAVVREALDAHAERVSPERRTLAMERLSGRHAAFVPIDELNALLESRGADVAPPGS